MPHDSTYRRYKIVKLIVATSGMVVAGGGDEELLSKEYKISVMQGE